MAFDRNIAGLALVAPVQAAADRSAIARGARVPRSARRNGPAASAPCCPRFVLRANGEAAAVPAPPGCEAADCFCPGLAENLLASVHVQDRPGFLKTISDALHQDRPASATVRLLGPDGARAMRLHVWPAAEAETVTALMELVEEDKRTTQPGLAADEDIGLCLLARAELLEVTSSLSVLCRSAEGAGSGKDRSATLRYLARRLDDAAELLSAFGDRAATDSGRDRGSLLALLQDITGTYRRQAAERQVSLSVDIAGAVRDPISTRFVPLLRLLVASAVETAAASGRVAIVTRREGRTAAISVTFPVAGGMDGDRQRAVFDLAVLRNLAIRHGGGLTTLHRPAAARQWVLRLPLGTGARGSDAPAQPENHIFNAGYELA